MTIRKATHCGSWYTDNKITLSRQLTDWLNDAKYSHGPARAIITPHAGYAYSGPTAAFAYKQIDPTKIEKVFILGPSHHVSYGDNCVLSQCEQYETPFYNMAIDKKVYADLTATGNFLQATLSHDEDEHSIEMQLPYVAKVMESRKGQFTIVPIIVGNLPAPRERLYGKILAPYLADSANLFVISSDFCHWGKRFRYTYFDEKFDEIWKSIENLDRMAMAAIESLESARFTRYQDKYDNTICGRHPIGILMNMVEVLKEASTDASNKYALKFIKYAQSEQCRSTSGSSVSYTAASLHID